MCHKRKYGTCAIFSRLLPGSGHGVCAAALSAERSRPTPRLAPGKQDQDDRHANSGADPESVCARFTDDHPACRRRGHPASAHTLVRVTEGHPATARIGCCSLRAACNSDNWKLMGRMGNNNSLYHILSKVFCNGFMVISVWHADLLARWPRAVGGSPLSSPQV
jgi:hypothetical protein